MLALLRPGGASGALDLCAYGFESLPSLTWELPGRESALLELHLTDNRLRTLPQVSQAPAGECPSHLACTHPDCHGRCR